MSAPALVRAGSGLRDAASLLSALTAEGRFQSRADVLAWLQSANESQRCSVRRAPLSELEGWRFEKSPLRFMHESGRFFSIEGVRTATNYGAVAQWDQPIIHQPEIGILGIVSRVFDRTRYFLMQRKIEPGNVNGAQISPTLQATRSNYSRVHGGHTPRYLEYFTQPGRARVIFDQLQSEQGSRFLGKRNRNVVVEPAEEPPLHEDYRWMTLGQIKDLLGMNNVVNMDARSVISCIPLPHWDIEMPGSKLTAFGGSLVESARSHAPAVHTISEIVAWFTRMRVSYDRRVVRRGLDCLDQWEANGTEIRHCDGEHFRVMGVKVEIGNREVSRWSQPLLEHPGRGLNGMVTQKLAGALHFAVRACLYPGTQDTFELGPTVSRSAWRDQFGKPHAPPFLDLFRDPDPALVRFSSVQSEEGGRFYHYQNEYVVLELPPESMVNLPEGYIWMTLGQIQELLPHGYFNIEARNILACLSLL